jgi:hypothetical protein
MEGARQRRKTREENEMHGMAEYEVWRQRPEELRREMAAIRLQKTARMGREGRFRLMGDMRWELERYAGLLMKRLGNPR